MYKMQKDGVVRVVATEAEAERWEAIGYNRETADDDSADPPTGGGNEKDPLASKSVEELKAFAIANGIDIGNATSQNGILKKIRDVKPMGSSEV